MPPPQNGFVPREVSFVCAAHLRHRMHQLFYNRILRYTGGTKGHPVQTCVYDEHVHVRLSAHVWMRMRKLMLILYYQTSELRLVWYM